MVQKCTAGVDGQLLVEVAKGKLLSDLEGNKFNTIRAHEIFQIAIEKAIWKELGEAGTMTIKAIRGEGILERFAQDYTEEFKSTTGASDQRSARRGLLAKIVGK